MKLILTQEVPGLGGSGDVVDVKAGYARNYLVRRGFGIRWTQGAEKQVDALRKSRAAREVRGLDGAAAVKSALETTPVRLEVRSGGGGRLFGAVTPADIVAAITAAGGPAVDKRRIEVGSPIKTVGQHRVTVRLHADVAATVALDVVAS